MASSDGFKAAQKALRNPIITQNVTDPAAAGVTYGGTSTAFTIADLSHVWIVCDV